jgi:predicted TIM-barrel fold metal-dependent hydrolase
VDLVDAHVHVPRLSTVSAAWYQWAQDYSKNEPWREVFGPDGDPVPARFDALMQTQGVAVALLFAEYSPRATGIQPADDLLPIIEYNPERFRLVVNVNPEVHEDPAKEASRQLDLGAVAVKIHPVHGGFRPDSPRLQGVYQLCADRQVPLITHTGPSIFPGSTPETGDPKLLGRTAEAFPDTQIVLAHGGRGHWYQDAADMAVRYPNVWLDLAGLPPKRLPAYYEGFDLAQLARKWIFGTDWPGVPGIAANATAIAGLGLPPDVLSGVLAGNARHVYRL